MNPFSLQKRTKKSHQTLVRTVQVNDIMTIIKVEDTVKKIDITNDEDQKKMHTKKTDRRRSDTEIMGSTRKLMKVDGPRTVVERKVSVNETDRLNRQGTMMTKDGVVRVKIDTTVGKETVRKVDPADMRIAVNDMKNPRRRIVIDTEIRIERRTMEKAMICMVKFSLGSMIAHLMKIMKGK